ncbi:MAG TPA: hypothetical protein VI997_06825 [Candidatus Thermoplasmatota archaeon]|nr:hypothetical protein [Candidatus Thermoplasmatota archaeon]
MASEERTDRSELWRIALSREGRVVPHWEALDALLDVVGVDAVRG